MLFYTVGQGYAFAAMLGCGLILGAWYDLVRALRRLMEAGAWLTAFLDAMFALGALVIVMAALLFVDRLEVRLYALVAAGAGMALYLAGIAPFFGILCRFLTKIYTQCRQNRKLKNIFHFFEK